MRQLKQLTSLAAEKPSTTVEEYVLEHFLLYHGLVGSTPENQRQFVDARADIALAVEQRNSLSLCIALKLQPLWWEDKLQTIVGELAERDRTGIAETVLPEGQLLDATNDPLQHEDWRVRANSAHILAFLQCSEALPRLAKALEDAADGIAQPAFPHIAYAIGRLQTQAAKETLQKYLYDKEPWFRVDAARALCLWPSDDAASLVLSAMTANHELSDYMSVVIARQYKIAELLQSPIESISSGALEVIIGITTAARQTFNPEIVVETNIQQCWDVLLETWPEKPSPLFLHAVLALADWMEFQSDHLSDALRHKLKSAREKLASSHTVDWVLQCLNKIDPASPDADGFARHTIKVVGDLQIQAGAEILKRLIRPGFIRLDEAIETTGKLGEISVVGSLIDLANKTVNIDERTRQALSKQPVNEEQPSQARTYWMILTALGNLPDEQSIDFLIRCSQDFAADKRQQALASLLSAISKPSPSEKQLQQISMLLESRLQDPATPVRITVLSGISQLGLISLLPAVAKLLNNRESSLSRAAYQTLQGLHSSGFAPKVINQLQQCSRSEFDSVKRQQLIDFTTSLKDSNQSV